MKILRISLIIFLLNNTYDIGVADGWTDLMLYDNTVILTGSTTNLDFSTDRVLNFIELENTSDVQNFQYGNNLEYYPGIGSTLIIDSINNKIYLPGIINGSGINVSNAYFTVTNLQGDSLKTVNYGDSTDIQSSIFLPNEGAFVFTGFKPGYNPDAHLEMRLFKCDTSGTILWEQTYGGSEDDYPFSLDRTHDGGYVMAGYTESWGAGGWDVYVVKTDSLGNLEWQKYFGNISNDVGLVKALDNGDLLIYGNTFHPQTIKSRAFVRKLDSLGNTKWQNIYVYDNDINNHHQILSCEITSDGYVFTGSSSDASDNTPLGWVLKTDFNGNELWSRRYRKRDSQNYLRDVIELPNGDLMACGFVFSEGIYTQDAWLMRLNCLGFDSLPEANGSLTTIPDYEVMLENESINWGNCIINWGDGTSNHLYEDYSTQLYHTYPNGNTYDIEIIALACNSSDTMHLQITPTFTGLTENESIGTFSMYPNPTSNMVTVQYTITNPKGKTNVSVYDLMGRKIQTEKMTQAQGSVEFSTLDYPNGMYLVVLSDDNGRHKTGKLVVRH